MYQFQKYVLLNPIITLKTHGYQAIYYYLTHNSLNDLLPYEKASKQFQTMLDIP